MLVELDLLVPFETIEVLEEQELFLWFASHASSTQVFDKCPRIDLLLNVQRDSRNDQGSSVLFILPPPDELRISVGVSWVEQRTLVRDGNRVPLVVGDEVPKLLGRDVRSLVGMDR
jgi:hypothetical protein